MTIFGSKSTRMLTTVTIFLATLSVSLAADPEIHVGWLESPPPIENVHYTISTNAPASVDYPDVRLLGGSLTWKVWSVDTDNPDDVGDIGVISSPAAANFGVKIMDGAGGPGARTVKGIVLDPTSESNYSSLLDGEITGNLDGDLLVQNVSTNGGDVTLTIGGDIEGNVTISNFSGNIAIRRKMPPAL